MNVIQLYEHWCAQFMEAEDDWAYGEICSPSFGGDPWPGLSLRLHRGERPILVTLNEDRELHVRVYGEEEPFEGLGVLMNNYPEQWAEFMDWLDLEEEIYQVDDAQGERVLIRSHLPLLIMGGPGLTTFLCDHYNLTAPLNIQVEEREIQDL